MMSIPPLLTGRFNGIIDKCEHNADYFLSHGIASRFNVITTKCIRKVDKVVPNGIAVDHVGKRSEHISLRLPVKRTVIPKPS